MNEQTTERTNERMCTYIPHISHIVSRRFTILLSEIERQLVKTPLAAAVGSYLVYVIMSVQLYVLNL